MIENPANSLLWHAGLMKLFPALPMCLDVDYEACIHGGNRPKKQKFRTTLSGLQPLGVRCDQKHWHEPWGLVRTRQGSHFATSEEAEYTQELCDTYVRLVAQETGINQLAVDTKKRQGPKERIRRHRAALATAAGRQSTRGSDAELVP